MRSPASAPRPRCGTAASPRPRSPAACRSVPARPCRGAARPWRDVGRADRAQQDQARVERADARQLLQSRVGLVGVQREQRLAVEPAFERGLRDPVQARELQRRAPVQLAQFQQLARRGKHAVGARARRAASRPARGRCARRSPTTPRPRRASGRGRAAGSRSRCCSSLTTGSSISGGIAASRRGRATDPRRLLERALLVVGLDARVDHAVLLGQDVTSPARSSRPPGSAGAPRRVEVCPCPGGQPAMKRAAEASVNGPRGSIV